MLYWICPECGHECSPAIRECPTCTAPPAPKVETPVETRIQAAPLELDETVEIPAGIAENLRSLAKNFEPSVALLTAGPQRRALAAAREAAIAIAEPEVETPALPQEPEPIREPELSQTLATLDKAVLRPIAPAWPKPVDLSAWPIAINPGHPALAGTVLSASAAFQLQPAGAVTLGAINFVAVPAGGADTVSKLREAIEPAHAFVALVQDRLPPAREGTLLETVLRPCPHTLNDVPPGHKSATAP